MKKQMSYYVQKLEEAGVDTSKFNLELNGVVMSVEEALKSEQVVGKTYLFDRGSFEKEIALETMRAMKAKAAYYDRKDGLNAYINDYLSSDVQFKDLLHFAKLLSKLEKFKDSDEYKVLASIYTFDLYRAYAEDYLKRLRNELYYHRTEGTGQLMKSLDLAEEMFRCTPLTYKGIYDLMKEWNNHYVKIIKSNVKCSAWKDAYKASRSYYTLSYLIKMGYLKTLDLNILNAMFNGLVEQGQAWRLYKTLESNQDVFEGIE